MRSRQPVQGVTAPLQSPADAAASALVAPSNIVPTRASPTMWILLVLPFIGLLWLPFYNHELPALFGFPFFYWYQLLWVPTTALLIWIVYQHDKKKGVE